MRRTFITLLVLLGLYLGVQAVLNRYTRDILQQIVEQQSDGKVRVTLAKVKLGVNPTRLDLWDTHLSFLDKSGKKEVYSVQFQYLGMQLASLRDFVFDRKLRVDFIVAEQPSVKVSPEMKEQQIRKGNQQVHFELGNIYKALQGVAQSLEIKRFGLINGNLTITNTSQGVNTIRIGGVDFHASELALLKDFSKSRGHEKVSIGKLRFNTGKQDITLPEGNYRIRYSSLQVSTDKKLLTIDSLEIAGHAREHPANQMKAGFSRLHVSNFDFWSLYDSSLVKVDSIICVDPSLVLKLEAKEKKKPGTGSTSTDLRKVIAGLTGKMNIGYAALVNTGISLQTTTAGKSTSFESFGNSFEIAGLRIDSSRSEPIHVDRLAFAIRNYKTVTRDGLNEIRFDSVIYANRSISLKNFRLSPSATNTSIARRSFFIPDFSLRDISFNELFEQKKIKATELVLSDAVVTNVYQPRAKTAEKPRPLRYLLQSLSDKIEIGKLRFSNAQIRHQSAVDKSQVITVHGLDSEVSLNSLFDANSYRSMGRSIDRIGFDSVKVDTRGNRIIFYEGEFRGVQKRITARRIQVREANHAGVIDLRNVVLHNYSFDDGFRDIVLDTLSYTSARFSLVGKAGKQQKGEGGLRLRLNHISAGPTEVQYVRGDSVAVKGRMDHLMVSGLVVTPEEGLQVGDVAVKGEGLSVKMPGVSGSAHQLDLADEKWSALSDISLDYTSSGRVIRFRMDSLSLVPAIAQSLNRGKAIIRKLRLVNPAVQLSLLPAGGSGARENKQQAGLQIADIELINAALGFDFKDKQGVESRVILEGLHGSIASVKKEEADGEVNVEKLALATESFLVVLRNDSIRTWLDKGNFSLGARELRLGKGGFHLGLDSLEARQLNLALTNKKGKRFELNRFDIGTEHLELDSLDAAHIIRRIKSNPDLHVSRINLKREDEVSRLYAYGLAYRNRGKQVSLDSFRYSPSVDRETFNSELEFQKDYISASTSGIVVRNIDLERLLHDSTLSIGAIEVRDPDLSIYKDKRKPFQHGIIKPLPVDMLKRVGMKFSVDSVLLRDGYVEYDEFNDKTNSIGKVYFTRMQVLLRNLRNVDLGPADSLYLLATARMLDTAGVRIRFNESYQDTLSAFLMTVRMSPVDLSVFNPVLVPLASAKVISGQLDTLHLRAIGREYLALGKMNLFYRKLKVGFLDKENQEKKTVMTRMVTGIANLVVRGNNANHTGRVFAVRIRERSVFNYWIRMVLGGAVTNAGIKSNRGQDKKYRRAARKINVPDIPEVAL